MDDVALVLADIVRDWVWDHPELHDIIIHKGVDGTIIIKDTYIFGLINDKNVVMGSVAREPVQVFDSHDVNFFDKLYAELSKLVQEDQYGQAWKMRAHWDSYTKCWTWISQVTRRKSQQTRCQRR